MDAPERIQAAVWEAKAESQLLWDVLYDIGYRSAAPDDLAWCQRKAKEACEKNARPGAIEAEMEARIAEAVKAEREACAGIALQVYEAEKSLAAACADDHQDRKLHYAGASAAGDILLNIRARGNQ